MLSWMPHDDIIRLASDGYFPFVFDVPFSAMRVGEHQAVFRKNAATRYAVLNPWSLRPEAAIPVQYTTSFFDDEDHD